MLIHRPAQTDAPRDLAVTELGVIQPTEDGLVLSETAPGVSVREVIDATDAPLRIAVS